MLTRNEFTKHLFISTHHNPDKGVNIGSFMVISLYMVAFVSIRLDYSYLSSMAGGG